MHYFKIISFFNFQHLKYVSSRACSSSLKVALVGGSGGIGQPLGLLLKKNPLISDLSLYDIVGTPGVAADLSHINSKAKVTAYTGLTELEGALKGANVVIIPAGMPRKPGMTRDDLFNTNASIVRDIAEISSKICPKAFIAIITNPVNSTVPIAAEIYKKNHVYDSKRIFGVTSLDVVRSEAFVSELKNLEVSKIAVPVVGGHSGITIIPLLSQVQPSINFSITEIKNLTIRIQEAGTEVVKAKAGLGSATLSMAHAGACFVDALIKGLKGHNSLQYSYVASNIVNGVDYFASPVEVGPNGVEKIYPLGKLSSFEEQLIQSAIPELKNNIEKGVKFITG